MTDHIADVDKMVYDPERVIDEAEAHLDEPLPSDRVTNEHCITIVQLQKLLSATKSMQREIEVLNKPIDLLDCEDGAKTGARLLAEAEVDKKG
jgi:predicted nucleic acid-binding protein